MDEKRLKRNDEIEEHQPVRETVVGTSALAVAATEPGAGEVALALAAAAEAAVCP